MLNIINSIFIFGAKYLYLIIIVIFFIWFLIQPKQTKKEILIIISFSLPLIFVIAKLAGYLYYNPRPFVSGHFLPLISHQPDNGFVSHHELLVSFISMIVFIFSRRLGFLFWILALCIGYCRIYAGVHHLIDIIGSILITIISVNLVYFFYTKRYTLYAKR